ncbi:AraC family transcriptional regulator [Vibrio sp.]|nr:AraC family transcriptional regulator [Vibrio sp.]
MIFRRLITLDSIAFSIILLSTIFSQDNIIQHVTFPEALRYFITDDKIPYSHFKGHNLEFWIPTIHIVNGLVITPKKHPENITIPVDQIEDLLNMPREYDEMGIMFHTLKYLQIYGIPKFKNVAGLRDMSESQLRRHMDKTGFNFQDMQSMVLVKRATDLMRKGESLDVVSAQLGFQNTQSFMKAFRKHRGITPLQYQHLLEEYDR